MYSLTASSCPGYSYVVETAFPTTVSYSSSLKHLPSPIPSLTSDCANPECCCNLLLNHHCPAVVDHHHHCPNRNIATATFWYEKGERLPRHMQWKKLSIECPFRKSSLQRKFSGVYDHSFGNSTISSCHDFASAHMPYLQNAQRINIQRQWAVEETSVVYHGATEVSWGWQMLLQKVNKMKKALLAGP